VNSRWFPVVGYTLVSSANQMLWLTFTPITTGSAHHYHVSTATIGWLAEVFPLLYVVLAIPMGFAIDRSLRATLVIGAVLTAAGGAIRLIGHGFGPVLGGQIVVAVAQPLVLNAVTKLAQSYLRPADRATGIAVSSAGIFAGMVLALALGAGLGSHRIPLLLAIQAGYGIVAAIVLCVGLLRRGARVTEDRAALRTVWADKSLRRLFGLVAAGFGVFVALTTWLQALLKPAGVSESAAGALLLVMVIGGVAGSAILPPQLSARGWEFRLIALSIAVAAAGCVVLAAAPGLWSAAVVVALIGLLLLTDLPVILELVADRAGPAAGTATGLIWLCGNAGGLLVAAAVQGLVHHPAGGFLLLAVIVLAALPLARPRR
jgi:predicted MFS family arabinose efflux permease